MQSPLVGTNADADAENMKCSSTTDAVVSDEPIKLQSQSQGDDDDMVVGRDSNHSISTIPKPPAILSTSRPQCQT